MIDDARTATIEDFNHVREMALFLEDCVAEKEKQIVHLKRKVDHLYKLLDASGISIH